MQRFIAPEPLLPGIPTAPTGKRFITAAEIDYQKRKRHLASRLPVLKPEDLVGTLEQPFYQTLLRDLMASGNAVVADEINNLLRKEERDRKSGRSKNKLPTEKLIEQPEVLQRIAETLKLEQTLLNEGKRESAMLMCKQLADSFLLQDRSIWLARHFYLAVLHRCRKICPKTTTRLQAEIHCLLAYIARENNESLESALAIAIDHLAVCRTLSRDQNWQFKPNTILIKLKKPIAFYGIISDDVYEVVDACTMSLYMIASLLEHELLISLANQIMHSPHHKAPTDDDMKNAHEFADLALQLALEVRQPVALSSALTRFGIVLRHAGAYDDAMKYFHQLQQHASLISDPATEAIAHHNLGVCFVGMANVVEALECFARQKELSSAIVVRELEGNAMHEIGHLLLQEGHLWEAEESYAVAFDNLHYVQVAHKKPKSKSSIKNSIEQSQSSHHHHNHDHHNHDGLNRYEIAWAMLGVAAGHKLWSRMAGLCRSEKPSDLRSVMHFKCSRKLMIPVERPDYKTQEVTDIKRPWEGPSSETSQQDDLTASETSWEEGFMFASKKEKKGARKVGFDTIVQFEIEIDDELAADEGEDGPPKAPAKASKVSSALDDLLAVKDEMEAENASKNDLHAQRVASMLEKDKARKSRASAMSARGSTFSGTLMDKKPSLAPSEE